LTDQVGVVRRQESLAFTDQTCPRIKLEIVAKVATIMDAERLIFRKTVFFDSEANAAFFHTAKACH
jgi:hypothetical protein